MLAFLDTEFTDLVVDPRLLSVGIAVADSAVDLAFYAEVTDRDRIDAASWFARDVVLPQFGKIAHADFAYAELGVHLSAFLAELTTSLATGELFKIAFGYYLDWDLVELAITDAGVKNWASIKRQIQPVNVYEMTGFGMGKLAADAYFRTQALAPFSRHHALCDARALRVAYEAATARE